MPSTVIGYRLRVLMPFELFSKGDIFVTNGIEREMLVAQGWVEDVKDEPVGAEILPLKRKKSKPNDGD